jgi:hypothetical protein
LIFVITFVITFGHHFRSSLFVISFPLIMYEFFLQHAITLVLVIALVIWAGIAWYLGRLESRLEAVERSLATREQSSGGARS